jgi:uncharacterized protein YbaR (Trm112 family)
VTDNDSLDILACPRCKGRLSPLPDGSGLSCAPCGVVYPVRDGIPVLVAGDAEDSTKGG